MWRVSWITLCALAIGLSGIGMFVVPVLMLLIVRKVFIHKVDNLKVLVCILIIAVRIFYL